MSTEIINLQYYSECVKRPPSPRMYLTGQWIRQWHAVQCCAKRATRCRKISHWCQNQTRSTAFRENY